MKIAVSASGGTTGAVVEQRFASAPYFVIVDARDRSVAVLANPTFTVPHAGGPRVASLLGVRGASVVLTGAVGASARVALRAHGIDVIEGVSGTVREALDRFLHARGA